MSYVAFLFTLLAGLRGAAGQGNEPAAVSLVDSETAPACNTDGVVYGWKFMQIGNFRLADQDGHHFSIASVNEKMTAEIFTKDGHRHAGPRTEASGHQANERAVGGRMDVQFGDKFIQIGSWRLADIDGEHFSIASNAFPKTCLVLKSDGTQSSGPRNDMMANERQSGPPAGLQFGQGFVQIGKWRIADTDGTHLTFAHADTGKVALSYKSDGHKLAVPRTDFTAWDRGGNDMVAGPCPVNLPHWEVGNTTCTPGVCRTGSHILFQVDVPGLVPATTCQQLCESGRSRSLSGIFVGSGYCAAYARAADGACVLFSACGDVSALSTEVEVFTLVRKDLAEFTTCVYSGTPAEVGGATAA